jgi:hypothetical protein
MQLSLRAPLGLQVLELEIGNLLGDRAPVDSPDLLGRRHLRRSEIGGVIEGCINLY